MLRHLVHTQPDIAFMEAPKAEHLSAVKRILRYVASTRFYGCRYKEAKAKPKLHGFSDDSKSTSKIFFFYGSCPISWQSQKQKVITLSSCESEYVAAVTASC